MVTLETIRSVDQFKTMIKGPLETAFNETRFLPHKADCPLVVIVIDALDECHSVDDDSWPSLLESLTCWSRLDGVFKLVITSRDLPDIHTALGKVSHRMNLTTGDVVSEESKRGRRDIFSRHVRRNKENLSNVSICRQAGRVKK